MSIKFPKFPAYAADGTTVSTDHDGFTLVATIHDDENNEAPDKQQDGFWPSLDPQAAGYIGDGKTADDLRAENDKMTAIFRAWEQGEWRYAGVAVTVFRAGVPLTGKYDNALWEIECNHPHGDDNAYLSTVADDLAGPALKAAREKVAAICGPAPALLAALENAAGAIDMLLAGRERDMHAPHAPHARQVAETARMIIAQARGV